MVRARERTIRAALSVAAVAAAALTIHGQPPAQDTAQTPSFRAGVNLVRVDVIATDRSGRALDTLTADDFEVRENGVRQTISTFKRISLTGDREPGGDALRPITSEEIEATEAAREDVRLFAVLLDDYHVTRDSGLWVRDQLASFADTQLGPADMIGVMYPLQAGADMHLTRDLDAIKRALANFNGRKHDYWPANAIEERYVFRLTPPEIEEIRLRVIFGAMEALIVRLGALKEGRKSLILVSEGLAPTSSTSPLDLEMDLREITNLANRQNVSIYSVDPRGLGGSEFGGTTNTLRVLAENTDGRAIINRNDITMAMKQIVSDASAYYLLGYVSTQPASDGKFHPIDVRVKRGGVELRHRRGYWAPTAAEAARAGSTAAAVPVPNPVADAIGDVRARDARMIHTWIGTSPGDPGRTRVTFVWEISARGVSNPASRPARVLLGASTRDEAYFLGRVPERPNPGVGRGTVAFEVAPGPFELRISVEDANGAVLDSETRTIAAPDFSAAGRRVGSPELYRARTVQETERLKSDPKATPAASPLVSRADHLWIRLPVYGAITAPSWTANLVSAAGTMLSELHADASRPAAIVFDVPIAGLAPSEYAVVMTDGDARTIIAFRVTP